MLIANQFILMQANDLLDWRIIENGSFVANLTVNQISYALEEMIDLMNSTLVNMNLTIVKKFSSSVSILAFFDKRRLQQVLLNLLSNAIKYSKSGIITVNAYTLRNLKEATMLVVKVKDEGIGLSASELRAIFKPFSA